MKKRPNFITGELYHVFARGVDKRQIFLDDYDRFRFIHDLYEFNDEAPASNLYYKQTALKSYEKSYEIATRKIRHERKPIIEILAFVIMPNHYHLLVRQLKDAGLVQFMKKLGIGYAMYFNKKYNRVGALFQGRFGAVHVNQESHFVHLPVYIHLNPLDLAMPEWRTHQVVNVERALSYLESYRWSSHLDYIGRKNFPSVISPNFVFEVLEGEKRYLEAIRDWILDPKIGLMDNHIDIC